MVEFDFQADDYNFVGSGVQALIELERENAKMRSTITRLNKTISELRREVLDLKRKLQ